MVIYRDNGDGTATLAFSYTAPKSKLDAMATEAGRYFYPRWPESGEWAGLTIQQRLDVLDREVKLHLAQAAYMRYTEDITQAAQDGMQGIEERYGT